MSVIVVIDVSCLIGIATSIGPSMSLISMNMIQSKTVIDALIH